MTGTLAKNLATAFGRVSGAARGLRRNRRGNVLMIFAFALVPLVFATGMTIDYARAARLRTKLNALADAAALSAVTPTMMLDTRPNAAAASKRMWYEQADGSSGLIYDVGHTPNTTTTSTSYTLDDGTLKIVVSDANTTGLVRTAQVSYQAASSNIFSSLLGTPKIQIGGSSTSRSSTSPNIDFYLLLDTSGSMALPVTSAGLNQLSQKTGGCAFACHSVTGMNGTVVNGTVVNRATQVTETALDANGKKTDFFNVARSYNITLRVDEEGKAGQDMMTLAASTALQRGVTYRASVSSFSQAGLFKNITPLTTNLTSAGTAAKGVQTSLYWSNSVTAVQNGNGNWVQGPNNNDTDTASSDAFTRMTALMPKPGNGTNNPGDKPQQIMFVVTDGMRDEKRANNRPEVAFDTTLCDTIKAKGIRIAILYTEYLPESMQNDSWSQGAVVPYLGTVEPALQSCASPGLYYKVTTDGDISAALAGLFQTAVATARLTN